MPFNGLWSNQKAHTWCPLDLWAFLLYPSSSKKLKKNYDKKKIKFYRLKVGIEIKILGMF